MTDDKRDSPETDQPPTDLSRRDFVTFSLAAGLAAAAGPLSAASLPVVEANVEVKTPDGTCDAAANPQADVIQQHHFLRRVESAET